jgi:hypothetical protein
MPGVGRRGDPLWFAIGLVLGVVPGIYFHQIGPGLALGFVLGGALSLIRADARNGYRRPADPLWFLIGLAVGVIVGIWLHYLGLSWTLGIGLGIALGLFLGAVVGTIRADQKRARKIEIDRLS